MMRKNSTLRWNVVAVNVVEGGEGERGREREGGKEGG